MSEINPGNYDGVNVTIVGRAGAEPATKTFDSGNSVTELSVAVGQGYKKNDEWVDTGTAWYRIVASSDYAANNWPTISKGDKVRLDGGRLETREFQRKDGSTGQAFEVRFGDLTVVESRADRAPAAAGFDAGEEPF